MVTKQTELKRLLAAEQPLVVPDAYDVLSARIIQAAGFKAVQCSGYSFSLNNLYKNERALSFEKNLEITGNILRSVHLPVTADGEDGYAEILKLIMKKLREVFKQYAQHDSITMTYKTEMNIFQS
ncbi:MAG: isocitrate lyase/phosphoenolpyruvate mutase family protein [Spirochaetia bacterium]